MPSNGATGRILASLSGGPHCRMLNAPHAGTRGTDVYFPSWQMMGEPARIAVKQSLGLTAADETDWAHPFDNTRLWTFN